MTRTPTPAHHAPLPPLAVLRIVAGLVGMIFAQLLPALARRPDLRMPLARATRALAAAAWAYALRRDGAHLKLRSAVLALRDVLLRIVAEDDAALRAPVPARAAARHLANLAAAAAPGPRARDGPALAPRPAA